VVEEDPERCEAAHAGQRRDRMLGNVAVCDQVRLPPDASIATGA
jgi:hypothetical protein